MSGPDEFKPIPEEPHDEEFIEHLNELLDLAGDD